MVLSTIVPLRPTEPPTRVFSIADLAAMPRELPSGAVRYELDNGRLMLMTPPGDIHGAVQVNIGGELRTQGQRRGLGKARTEVGVILWRDPDRVVGMDAAFIENASLPIRLSPEGYLETIPGLAVEVKSKNDTQPFIEKRVQDFLKAGVKVVWIADPETRTVSEYRSNAPARVYAELDTLTVEDVIPGFRMAVRDVFQV